VIKLCAQTQSQNQSQIQNSHTVIKLCAQSQAQNQYQSQIQNQISILHQSHDDRNCVINQNQI